MPIKEFRFRAWFIGALRRISYRYPPRYSVLAAARVERGKYKCALCPEGQNIHARKDIQLDHVVPMIPLTGFPLKPDGTDDWGVVVDRLFCTSAGFQAICSEHHALKSKEESGIRKSYRVKKAPSKVKVKKARKKLAKRR